MGQNTNNHWRVEVKNPQESTDWRPLWEFGADQYAAHEELIKVLNQLNAPVELRIAYVNNSTSDHPIKDGRVEEI